MRYLTDSEILKWGEELNLCLLPRYSSYGGIDILIDKDHFYKRSWELPGTKKEDLKVIKVNKKYNFTFSISENRVNEFENFLRKNSVFGTKLLIEDLNSESSMLNPKKYIDIEYLDQLNSFTKEKHSVYNRPFIRYKYEFDCHFATIIAVVTLLKDAIDYIAMIWGYDEDGNEIKLLKYNIGDIVSTKKNKSIDYLIVDHKTRYFNNKKELVYILSEIIANEKSSVIKYGEVLELFEDNICHSRNERINNILN